MTCTKFNTATAEVGDIKVVGNVTYQYKGNDIWEAITAPLKVSQLTDSEKLRKATTVAEIATGVFKVGDRLEVTDRANGHFNVVIGVSDSVSKLNAGGGNIAELDISSNDSVNILSLGIKADALTINKLAPIANFANTNNVSLHLNNTAATVVLFDDTCNIRNTRLWSLSGMHLRYVGGDIDYLPVITLGEVISTASPERFKTSGDVNLFRSGEAITFSSGGFGDVLFVMGGYVYFHFVPDYIEGGTPQTLPSSGTATGSVSGAVQTITESRVATYSPSGTFSASIDNIFLGTILNLDGDGLPRSHVKATGIYANGLINSRGFGSIGTASIQGFWHGSIMSQCFLSSVTGTLTTNRCAYGSMFVEETNAININSIVSSTCGTQYDIIPRYSQLYAHNYGVTISNLDTEVNLAGAPIGIIAQRGLSVAGGDIESFAAYTFEISGSPSLKLMTNTKTTYSKSIWSSAIKIPNCRFSEVNGFSLIDFIDGIEVAGTFRYGYGSLLGGLAGSYVRIDGNHTNLHNICIGHITSTKYDFHTNFNKQTVLSSKISFVEGNYRYISSGFSGYAPSTLTDTLNKHRVSDAGVSISIEFIRVSLGIDNGHAETISVYSNVGTAGNTWFTSVPLEREGAVTNTTFTNKYLRGDSVTTRLTGLNASNKNITHELTFRILNT